MNKKNKNGYSIIEIIVYLAIFTSLSVLVINSFIVILSSFNTTNINRKLLESGTISMERISREIHTADSIDPSTTATMLVLLKDSIPVTFVKEDNDFNLYEDGVLSGNLLSQNISLTNLVFRRIITAQTEAIKIEMTLEFQEGARTKSENFYDTIILRGGYN